MRAKVSGAYQRGAIGLMAVATLMIACLFLMLALDSGRLYLTKRNLQRVADMAALEAITRSGSCLPLSTQHARENAKDRNNFDPALANRAFVVTCGRTEVSGPLRVFVASGAQGPAVQVVASERVAASLVMGGIFGQQVTLSASAVAQGKAAIGRLAIRNQLVGIDTERSILLNALVGGLLGGNLNLQAVSWQGLANTGLNLLGFLDELAIELGVGVGDYQQVLNSQIGVGRLLDVAARVLRRGGNGVDIAANALASIGLIVPPNAIKVKLADILNVQQGVEAAALDVGLNALQLVEALAQLSNAKNGVAVDVAIPLPGVTNASISVKVIEPAQISAIGDLARAKANPLVAGSRIYVRTAQVRTLISLDVSPLVKPLLDTLDATVDSLAPVTGFLNETLKLNLVGALTTLLSGILCSSITGCPDSKVAGVELPLGRLDLSLDVGGAEAYVTDYSCGGNGAPSMAVSGNAAVGYLRLGKLGSSVADAKQAVFSSAQAPVVQPVSLLVMGERTVRPKGCVLFICGGLEWKRGNAWVDDKKFADISVLAGLGLSVDAPLLGSRQVNGPVTITQVPRLDQPAKYQDLGVNAGSQLVGSLSSTLSGITLKAYKAQTPNVLGALLTLTTGLIDGLVKPLQNLISGLLSPLVDPLLRFLLDTLGINLSKTEVGVSMQCGHGAQLAL